MIILYVKNIGGPPSLTWSPTSILRSKNPSYSPAAKGDVMGMYRQLTS
jgi:hypothetical protein